MFNNKELNYASAKTADLVGEMVNRVPGTIRPTAAAGPLLPANMSWMDFDPMIDDNYLVDSAASNELKWRGIYTIDEAVFLMPLELVPANTISG